VISFQSEILINIALKEKFNLEYHVTCEICVKTQIKIMTFRVLSYCKKKFISHVKFLTMQTKIMTFKVSSNEAPRPLCHPTHNLHFISAKFVMLITKIICHA